MLTVALTGGIGSGKSLVGEYLEALGAIVVDSDQLSREVIERGSDGFDALVAHFGDSILKDGSVDRSALARIIFDDPAERKALEAIIHPRVRARFESIVAKAGDGAVIVNQIPLLVETDGAGRFDLVVTVESTEELRVSRAVERGLKEYEVRKRIASQANDAQRRAIADFVLINNGTKEEFLEEIKKIIEKI